MPVRRFWMMNSNVNRLMAERDLRGLSLAVSAQGGDATEEHRKNLVLEIGNVAKEEEKLDRQGLEELRAMSFA